MLRTDYRHYHARDNYQTLLWQETVSYTHLDVYKRQDETHGEGYLRAFFNKVKAGTYSSIERCFITGVSPVTMDDLTSGFNTGNGIRQVHQ